MKFLGEFIQHFISRFRNDVFLEDVGSGTIASGGNLGLDSNNKIVKATSDNLSFDGSTANGVLTHKDADEISVESTLSYTSETLSIGADDDGEAIITRLAHGDNVGGDLSIKAGDGTGTNKLGGDLNLYGGTSTGAAAGGKIAFFASPGGGSSGSTASTQAEVGSISSSGSLQIDGGITTGSTSFVNSSGVVQVAGQTNITGIGTITTGVWNGTTIATANTAAKVTSVIAGDGIDVDSTTGDVTVTAETASATNPGIVELATTAEADSGTDTARAITAAGLKSHVDARFSYQNISFTGQATVPSDGDWITVSANGISNHTWNTNLGSGGTSVGSTTVTIPTGQICQGIIVPYDCVLVGFASLIRSVGNHQSKVGLAVGVPTYNDFATFDCTLRAYNAADVSAGPDSNYSQRPTRADFLTANYAMSAGHVIFPLIGSVASNSRSVQWNCTLVLKTLIP